MKVLLRQRLRGCKIQNICTQLNLCKLSSLKHKDTTHHPFGGVATIGYLTIKPYKNTLQGMYSGIRLVFATLHRYLLVADSSCASQRASCSSSPACVCISSKRSGSDPAARQRQGRCSPTLPLPVIVPHCLKIYPRVCFCPLASPEP